MRMLVSVIAIALLLLPDWALAQASIPLITTQPTANGGSDYSLSLQILLLMSLLTLLPLFAVVLEGVPFGLKHQGADVPAFQQQPMLMQLASPPG